MRLAEGRLLADDDPADRKVLVEGDVLQPLEQVRFAGPEVTAAGVFADLLRVAASLGARV